VVAPTCNAVTTTTQQCICSDIFNSPFQNCSCIRVEKNVVFENKQDVVLNTKSQCSCLDQVVDGKNFKNCTCCVPLTFCETLANPLSRALNCGCKYVIVDGKITTSCDCDFKANNTLTVKKAGMKLDDNSQCCCAEFIDPRTKIGSRRCNCTQPPVRLNENCECTRINNTNQLNCSCNDCNNIKVSRNISQQNCTCRQVTVPTPGSSSNSNSNRTANATANQTTTINACSCSVDFTGLCQTPDITKAPIDEGVCDAINTQKFTGNFVQDNCAYEYEYLVAVVATKSDSSALVNVQSFQRLLSGSYLNMSVFVMMAAIALSLFTYY